MPARNIDQPIRVLHLSDVHFKTGKKWDADPVLRELARFIADELKNGLALDLVALTGDLAHAGLAEEYALARDWLENQLWPAVGGLPRDRLLLVPGNHDVDRGKVDLTANAVQTLLLNGRDQQHVAIVLGDKKQRSTLLKRHDAYMRFRKDWFGTAQPLPWWQRMIEIRGTRLHVAGLDSAWMACDDDDRGRLLLGRYQLTQTVETAQAEGAHWRIALLHHSWDYLAEFDHDSSRSHVHQHCDLLLRGHLHKSHSAYVRPADPSRGCVELAAGCVYETSQYPNAFQWIELSPTGKRARVHFRAWLHNAWDVDRNQPGCGKGYADFDLDAQPPTRKARQSEPHDPPPIIASICRICGRRRRTSTSVACSPDGPTRSGSRSRTSTSNSAPAAE